MADAFPGYAHVAVTISDIEVSRPWYTKLFGADPVLDEDTGPFRHTVWALPGGTLYSLHFFKKDLAKPGPADEFRQGLDHVGFAVPNRSALEEWAKRLDELGIEHGKIVDASYGSGLAFRDPDNIQLEFFAPPS
jgi:glyoxylase I family protein